MEKLIFDYLSQYYYISTSKVGNHGIYKLYDSSYYETPANGVNIINEINSIYSINKETIFEYINVWCLEQNTNVNLRFYWKTNSEVPQPVTLKMRPGHLPQSYYMKYLNMFPTK